MQLSTLTERQSVNISVFKLTKQFPF